ncbi:MAG: hypothetical protein AAFY48_18985 [Bacteroidota bacterium]
MTRQTMHGPNGSVVSTGEAPSCCCQPKAAVAPPGSSPPTKRRAVFSFLLSLGVAFFPKCPICWMAYMSLFSAFGLEAIPYQPWMLPVMGVLLLFHLGLLWYSAHKHQAAFGPLYLSLAGVALVALGKFGWPLDWVIYTGLGLLFAATLWHAVPATAWRWISTLKLQFFTNPKSA